MAKQKGTKQKSVTDLLNMDLTTFNALDEKTLRKYATTMMSAANKRLKRMEEKGLTAYPAYSKRQGKRFSVANQNLNQLRRTFTELKGFLGSETGGVKGITKIRKKIQKGLKEKGIKISLNQIDDLFKAINKARELHPDLRNEKEFVYELIDLSNKLMKENKSQDDILNAVLSEYDQMYKDKLMKMGFIDNNELNNILWGSANE